MNMNNDDSISRVNAIKALCKAGCESEYCGISCDDVKAIEDLPSAQPTQSNTPNTLNALDCIDRQAAIDALKGFEFCHYMEFGEYIGEDTREVRLIRAEKAKDALQNLPPSQPSFPQVHENDHIADVGKMDCISRQAAIDVLDVGADLLRRVLDDMDVVGVEREKYKWGLGLIESYISDMNELPSAQPEPCEDAVSRKKVFEYFVSLWECIGTIMDRDEWEDACKTTANELPSAQPKIVRCKDCRWKEGRECVRFSDVRPYPDDFCSRAERKKVKRNES